MIYFDNASTTIMPSNVIQVMLSWINKGNPSANYASANKCKNLINDLQKSIAYTCEFTLADELNDTPAVNEYRVVITSSASECNTTILRCTTEAYYYNTGTKPHIIISAIEHDSALSCAHHLQEYNLADVTYVLPNDLGFIVSDDIEKAILPNTCLIFIMHANNETGVINDIKEIGDIARQHDIPFYTDTAQSFSKIIMKPTKYNVDAFCISFHKMHGPPGIAALVLTEHFLRKLPPLIFGKQNSGFRGGTENIMAIAGAHECLCNGGNIGKKNTKTLTCKKYIIDNLSKYVPVLTYAQYIENSSAKIQNSLEIVIISPGDKSYLPNILLLSVVKRDLPKICNGKLKKKLEDRGIIISIGSACNTSNPKASHVLYAMNVDSYIRSGVLRLSFSANNTLDECEVFVKEFIGILKEEVG